MYSFSLIDVLLLIGVGQGLFLSITIPAIKDGNRSANSILNLIIIFATIMLFGRVFIFRFQYEWMFRVGAFVDTTIFLFGPLFYLYVKRMSLPSNEEYKLGFWHFAAPALYLIYYMWVASLSNVAFKQLLTTFWYNVVLLLTEFLGLVSFTIYWFKTSFLVFGKRNHEVIESNENDSSTKRFLKLFVGIIGLLILFWMIGFTNYFIRANLYFNYEVMWILTPVLLHSIGYYSVIQPHILRKSGRGKNHTSQRIDSTESTRIQKGIKVLIEEEHIYKIPSLSLKSLAEKLETSPNNLSWVLNNVYNESFYSFINKVRIDAFQGKIKNHEHSNKTLLGLAMDVGFNSKSTFNKAFKIHMGSTPSRYVNSLRIDKN